MQTITIQHSHQHADNTSYPHTVHCSDKQGPQFSAEREILSQAAEFAHFRGISVFMEFCGIRYWTVIRGQIQHILVQFRLPYCMYA